MFLKKSIFSPSLSLFLFLLTLVSLPKTIIAQSKLDSLRLIWLDSRQTDQAKIEAINAAYPLLTYNKPESSLELASLHLTLAQRQNSEEEISKALNECAYIYYLLGSTDSSLVILEEALQIQLKLGDSLQAAVLNTNIGNIYRAQKDYQKAIDYYLQGFTFIEKKPEEVAYQADLLNNLGLIYYDVGMLDSALNCYTKAFSKYAQAGILEEYSGNIWLNTGALFLDKSDLDKSRIYLYKALHIFNEKHSAASKANTHFYLAKLYKKLNHTDSALYQIKQAIDLNIEYEKVNLLDCQLFYAELIADRDPNKALIISLELKDSVIASQSNASLTQLYKVLYQSYKALGKSAKALEMHELYLQFHNKELEEGNNAAVIRTAIYSDFNKKLHKSELKSQNEKASLKLKQLKQTYLILFLSVFFIAVLSFFARYRIGVLKQEQESLLKEIEKIKRRESSLAVSAASFQLKRDKIEAKIERKLNETDWRVLNLLLDDPVLSNQQLAEAVYLSIDGLGSSLRRMYQIFDIKESRYKKTSLIMEVMKISVG